MFLYLIVLSIEIVLLVSEYFFSTIILIRFDYFWYRKSFFFFGYLILFSIILILDAQKSRYLEIASLRQFSSLVS